MSLNCSFCGASPRKRTALVNSDKGDVAICSACVVTCTEIMLGINRAPDTKPEGAPPAEKFPRLPTLSLRNFIGAAEWWASCHVPSDTRGFVSMFLKAYEAAVRVAAAEFPAGDPGIESAFEKLMRGYVGEPGHKYVGATFSAIVGGSMRQAFRDHVAIEAPACERLTMPAVSS